MSLRYSTAAVSSYSPCGIGPDLPLTIQEANIVRTWYNWEGFQQFTSWENGDVWGSDFRDAAGGDLDPDGGTDVPDIYFFCGHGMCQNPPQATDPDFLLVCGNFGKPDIVNIGAECRWGNNNLKFMFIDASCPMDLVSMANNWIAPFQGLHMAVGHSGDGTHDALDSADRGGQFAVLTTGGIFWVPQESVGDAWMSAGIIDIQPGCCAVACAGGGTEFEAYDRVFTEKLSDNRPRPGIGWIAFRWICT